MNKFNEMEYILDNLIKIAFKITGLFWILSPLIFASMRKFGVFDFVLDWAVFLFLSIMSGIAMFFCLRD